MYSFLMVAVHRGTAVRNLTRSTAAMACWSPGLLMGFLPGLILGFFSLLLLATLWNRPTVVLYSSDGEVLIEGVNMMPLNSHELSGKKSARRYLENFKADARCSTIYLNSSVPSLRETYLLLVLIHSNPGSFQRRESIRDTWLQTKQNQKTYVARFVVGIAGLGYKELQQLACENKEHSDMIFLPTLHDNETEFSSSQKLLLSFTWAEENVAYHYLFKCMDSTFVILDVLLGELENRTKKTDLLWGFFAGGVTATKEGYLKEPNWFLCTHYLPYPQGGGYVISQGLVSMIHTLGPGLQHYLHDDIALGVWLSPFNGIHYVHDVRFNTGYYSRGCNNLYVVTHRETIQSMLRKYASLQKKAPLCVVELLSKPSYEYNWRVPADKCCIRKMGIP